YLLIALGGALGGVFVGLVAPAIFTSFWEFNVMATVAWVVLAIVFARDKQSFFFTGDRWHFYLLLWFLFYLGLRFSILFTPLRNAAPPWLFPLWTAAALSAVAVLVLAWLLRRRRLPSSKFWPRILVGLIIFLAECFMVIRIRSTSHESIAADRNFFGTLRILRTKGVPGRYPPFLRLAHGQINHGIQYLDPELRREPVSYYGPGTGIARAVRLHPRRLADPPRPMRIGVLGLGTGTIAAFAQPGDTVRFYEINPTVIEFAAGQNPYFTYLADSPGDCEVVLGDARLALERERRDEELQKFDVLAMDAFSSDSVPVHLLTREALALYTAHLRNEQSIIAINISNRFLDFRDLVTTLAADAGFTLHIIDLPVLGVRHSPSRWALLCRDPAVFTNPGFAENAMAWTPRRSVLWTDSFSNLFHLIRRRK
ncbi:MAG: hypothetical protein HKN82_04245, partial [Akkermansiaceae bacterium]|nr:hypothetical protein [Akkermansiaceae bacterium]